MPKEENIITLKYQASVVLFFDIESTSGGTQIFDCHYIINVTKENIVLKDIEENTITVYKIHRITGKETYFVHPNSEGFVAFGFKESTNSVAIWK